MKEYKELIGKEDFRTLVKKAANLLADPVAMTLGPEGLPILLERKTLPPVSTKDGVTVAKNICVSNRLNTIVEAMKEASQKTNDEVGDGTTTAIVLMREFINESLKYIAAGTVSPQELIRNIRAEEERILKALDEVSTPIKNKQDQLNVASISANGDVDIADKIVKAIDMAGEAGYIAIEEGHERENTVDFIEGYTLSTGWNRLGPYGLSFVTHPQGGHIELMEPAILLYDGVITDMQDLANFYITLTANGVQRTPLLIVSYGIEGQAFDLLLANRRAGFTIGIVKCPLEIGVNTRRYVLEDLAILTGGSVVDHGTHALSKQALITDGTKSALKEGIIGSCKKVVIKRHDTIIYDGCGAEEEQIGHMETLKATLEGAESEYEKEIIKLRMSKMVGGIVELGVGGNSELEMKERKFRVEDALNATRAAISHGVVAGGGAALLGVADRLYGKEDSIVSKIFYQSLQSPIRQILVNAGIQPDIVIHEILKQKNSEYVYDVRNKVFDKDAVTAGIIDPVKVTKHALKNAISIACELMVGGGMITSEPPKNALGLSKEDLLPDLYNDAKIEETQNT